MVQVVNLNKVRKEKKKTLEKQQADSNRILFGLTRDAKQKALAERQMATKALDGKKMDE